MVVSTSDEEKADRLFGALANPTRRDIVRRSMRDDYSVSALARCYTTSFAAVQKHVALLEAAGLVSKRPRGREQIVRGNTEAIETARRLLEEFEEVWRERIDLFDEVLTQPDPGQPEKEGPDAGDRH
jgi:DNA-binding transcriptional ArsR family regulator